jgi:hypothetical protein
LGLAAVLAGVIVSAAPPDDAYLGWSAKQAQAVGTAAYKRGRVGGLFDGRVLKTERSYNYKLAATWLTGDVIRATARLVQLASRLSPAETQALVAEAESIAGTVIMIELDPREGSGVIPSTWEAFLQPKGRADAAKRGMISPQLRDVKALSGVLRRNYDYDRFWVVFPLTHEDGSPVFRRTDATAELVVHIHDKEGHVEWTIPEVIKTRQ